MAFPLRLLDLVLPRRCAACGGGEELLCSPCRNALWRLGDPLCARCGAPTAWPVGRCRECAGRRLAFATARAAVAYDGPARPLVAAWKERGLRPLAREFAALVAETVPRPLVDELTFVPGDPERSLKRGQNAAEALARELAGRWEVPVGRLLVRAEPARPQRGSRGTSGAATCAGRSPPWPAPAGASPSSTTSTRRERPWGPQPPSSAGRERASSTW
jgi:predicted amidophosphoribosyltransferase